MPYVQLQSNAGIPIACNFQGEVFIPLFTPPYTVAELNLASADSWFFSSSTDYATINDLSIAGIGFGNQIVSSLTSVVLTPFTYFTTKFKPSGAPIFQSVTSIRANGFFNAFVVQSAVTDSWRDTHVFQPLINKTLTGVLPAKQYFSVNAGDCIFSAVAPDFPGYYATGFSLTQFATLRPGTNAAAGNGVDWFGSTPFFPYTPETIRSFELNPLTNASIKAGHPYPLAGTNITPIGMSWGNAGDQFGPRFVRWRFDCFTSAQALVLKPVFSETAIQNIFFPSPAGTAVLGGSYRTTPIGFILTADAQSYTSQFGTYILVSFDLTKYWRLKFVPQSPGANTAINVAGIGKIFIDKFGVTYFARESPTLPRGIIYNSQGFNFPFLFNTTRLPYVSLPCWPPCYGVPLMKGNAL